MLKLIEGRLIMSVGLFISYRSSQKEDRLVPIASDYIFSKHWKPICEELHLRWIPRLQHGWMLSVQDMPHILTELGQLQRYLACGETHVEISHHMLARISVLMRELNEVHKNMNADAFVGSPWQAQRRTTTFHRVDVAPRRETPVRSGLRPTDPLISHPEIMDPKAVSETLRAALEPAAPADRLVDPLPGTACSADSPRENSKTPWTEKLRSLFGQEPDSVPPAWRTALDDL